MRLHFATIPLHDSDLTAEEELNRFLATHRIVSVDRQFVSDGARSVWAICVTWVEGRAPDARGQGESRKGRVDYRDVLDADHFAVFAKLRDFRKAIAEREGVPPYTIFC